MIALIAKDIKKINIKDIIKKNKLTIIIRLIF